MKKLQIVRVDSDSVLKADLQVGENIIGIGVVAGCKDERVPKHAITINVTPEGEMTINPVAPCYMKSPGTSGWVQLEVGSTVPIHSGDLFSLLSDKYWFKVISVDADMGEDESSLKRKLENSTDSSTTKKPRQDGSVEALLSPNDNLNNVPSSLGVDPGQEEINPLDYEESASPSTEPTGNDIYGASVPEEGKVPDTNSSTKLGTSGSKDSVKSEEPNESEHPEVVEPTDDDVQEKNSTEFTENGDVDDSLDVEDAGKKIKWGCGQHFSDRSDPNAGNPSELQDFEEPAQSTSQNEIPAPAVEAGSSSPMRNMCMYGSKCYRTNKEHKVEFSHPGDADYEALDNRPECRYGVRCYRKNPQHRKDFKHTIRRRRRPQTPIRAKTPDHASATDQSSYEESVDESEYEPSWYTDSSDDVKSDWDDK